MRKFLVVSTETGRKEVYVMARDWEHAEKIASGDVDWKIVSVCPATMDGELMLVYRVLDSEDTKNAPILEDAEISIQIEDSKGE